MVAAHVGAFIADQGRLDINQKRIWRRMRLGSLVADLGKCGMAQRFLDLVDRVDRKPLFGLNPRSKLRRVYRLFGPGPSAQLLEQSKLLTDGLGRQPLVELRFADELNLGSKIESRFAHQIAEILEGVIGIS